MALDSILSGGSSLLRSSQILAGADALLSDPTDPVLTAPVASPNGAGLGAVLDIVDGGSTAPADAVTGLANAAVLNLHSTLETFADANGLIGSVHGITTLGETAGLGHIGGSNLVTTLLDAPTALATGDTSILGQILPETTAIDGAVDHLAAGAASDGGANPALVAPLADPVTEAQDVSLTPAETLANSAVLDLHYTLEAAADAGGLSGSVHGLTNLGETVGLGEIGGSNLVTDILDTPTSLLSGDTSPLTHIPTDVTNIIGAAEGLVSGVESDVASGAFLANPIGNTEAIADKLTTFPATSLANEAIDTVHATLETIVDPIAPNTIHGVIGVGNAVGLGEIGGANALTDVLDAPSDLLAGNTTPITSLPGSVASIGTAAGNLLGDVGTDLTHSPLIDALTHPATGGGALAGNLPGAGVLGDATSTLADALNDVGADTGLGSVTHAVTAALGTGTAGPLDGVLHVPGDVLGGASEGAAPLPGESGATLGSLGTVVEAAAGTLSDLGESAGGADGLVGTVTGLAGGLGSSGSGSGPFHDLVTLAVGPQTPTSGTSLDVLSNGADGQTHLIDSHVGTTQAPVPTIANVAVLPDASLHFPTPAGGGSDALSGVLGSIGSAAGPTTASSDAHIGLDLGALHVDLPIAAAHADPLAALGHAVHA